MAGAAAMIGGRIEEDDPLQTEAEFIAFWNQGLEIAAIAQRLGLSRGTVQSRAHRLQQQGKIQPRPRGGNDPSQRAKARQEDPPAPVQRPVQRTDTGAVQRLDRREDEVQSLRLILPSGVDRLDYTPV
jgi:transposase